MKNVSSSPPIGFQWTTRKPSYHRPGCSWLQNKIIHNIAIFNDLFAIWTVFYNFIQNVAYQIFYISDLNLSNIIYICEDESKDFSCNYEKRINLVNAMYGRTRTDICPHASVVSFSTECWSNAPFSTISDLCQGMTSCTLTAHNDIYNVDPCPGIYKYLTVEYTCEWSQFWFLTTLFGFTYVSLFPGLRPRY